MIVSGGQQRDSAIHYISILLGIFFLLCSDLTDLRVLSKQEACLSFGGEEKGDEERALRLPVL